MTDLSSTCLGKLKMGKMLTLVRQMFLIKLGTSQNQQSFVHFGSKEVCHPTQRLRPSSICLPSLHAPINPALLKSYFFVSYTWALKVPQRTEKNHCAHCIGSQEASKVT